MAKPEVTADQVKAQAHEAADDLGRHARRAADDAAEALENAKERGAEFVEAARKRGGEYVDNARERGHEYAGRARDEARRIYREGERRMGSAAHQAEDYYDEVSGLVRRNPAQALGIAAGLGFLLGLIVARR